MGHLALVPTIIFLERSTRLKLFKQLFLILLFSLLGEVLSLMIASVVAIPGSVIGMILLFLALHFHWLKIEQVDEVGTWLTDNMGIFFVPAGVGLITNFDILSTVWWQLLIIIIITVIILLGLVGQVVQSMKGQQAENEGGE